MRTKPKILKDTVVEYNGIQYDKVISISKGYDYSNFSYLDEKGSECTIYVGGGSSFSIVNS